MLQTLQQSYSFAESLREDLREEFDQLGGRVKREMNHWAEQLADSITRKANASPQPFLALSGDVGDMGYLRWEILKFKLIESGCELSPLANNRSNWSIRKAA